MTSLSNLRLRIRYIFYNIYFLLFRFGLWELNQVLGSLAWYILRYPMVLGYACYRDFHRNRSGGRSTDKIYLRDDHYQLKLRYRPNNRTRYMDHQDLYWDVQYPHRGWFLGLECKSKILYRVHYLHHMSLAFQILSWEWNQYSSAISNYSG